MNANYETGRAYFFSFHYFFALNYALIKCRLLRFAWQVLFLTCRCNYYFCFVFLAFCVLLRVPLLSVEAAEFVSLLPV